MAAKTWWFSVGRLVTEAWVRLEKLHGFLAVGCSDHGISQFFQHELFRLAQPFSLRVPFVDGHGNFGSLDDGPAASRYTEAKLRPEAMSMTESLEEDVIDFVPNYDGQLLQPEVLPASFPNLLVNGASGIAVGMATNMAPHNLVEVVSAARFLLNKPEATLDELMKIVPGPDLPTGGTIIGLDGIREAESEVVLQTVKYNAAIGPNSTIGGGRSNTANSSQYSSTVAGGYGNAAVGENSAVLGGTQNTASGGYSAVGGGISNEATGQSSVVSGGNNNAGGMSSGSETSPQFTSKFRIECRRHNTPDVICFEG